MIANAPDIHADRDTLGRGPARRTTVIRWPGWVFVLTTLFLAIGAFNGQNNLLFFTFGLGVTAILVSGVIGGSSILGLTIERLPPGTAQIGSNASLRYEARNTNRFLPIFGVTIDEIVDRDRTTAQTSLVPALILSLRAGETSHPRATVVPRRSGVLTLRGYRVRSSMPFGLLEKRIEFPRVHQIDVVPATLPVRGSASQSRGRSVSTSSSPSRHAGGMEEFLGVREYVPGDPTRSISWARSAAHDTLVVKTHSLPRPDACVITVEPTASSPHELESVLTATASLAADRIQHGIAVALEIPHWDIRLPARAGRGQLARILTALARRGGPSDRFEIPRHGERIRVTAGRATGGAGLVIDAADQASWLAPRTPVPESLRPDAPAGRGSSLAHKVRVFTGSVRT
ncbi:MAG: DUF58 domain-containing protein [Phycisphaerales bacterium JB040]